jgi:hypothetical protein
MDANYIGREKAKGAEEEKTGDKDAAKQKQKANWTQKRP